MPPPLPPPLEPNWLIENFLFGVSLTNDDDEDFPISMFENTLRSSVAGIGSALNQDLDGLKTYTERHDVTPTDRGSYFLKQLRHRPVRRILKTWIQYGAWPEVELPAEWVFIKNENSGRLEIIPGPGALTGAGANIPYMMGFLGSAMEREWKATRMPGWLKVQYEAGYDGDQYPIPYDILQAIGLRAAKPILITAGDLILGAGIANESFSMDGMSQSIGSTASAENNAYSAQIKENQKQYDEIMMDLRARMRGVMVAGI